MTLVQGELFFIYHGGAVGAELTAFRMKTCGLIGLVEFVEVRRFSRRP